MGAGRPSREGRQGRGVKGGPDRGGRKKDATGTEVPVASRIGVASQTPYFSRSSTFRTFPDTVIGKESRICSLLGTL